MPREPEDSDLCEGGTLRPPGTPRSAGRSAGSQGSSTNGAHGTGATPDAPPSEVDAGPVADIPSYRADDSLYLALANLHLPLRHDPIDRRANYRAR